MTPVEFLTAVQWIPLIKMTVACAFVGTMYGIWLGSADGWVGSFVGAGLGFSLGWATAVMIICLGLGLRFIIHV